MIEDCRFWIWGEPWRAWGVLRAAQARLFGGLGNPGRCPGLWSFMPLGGIHHPPSTIHHPPSTIHHPRPICHLPSDICHPWSFLALGTSHLALHAAYPASRKLRRAGRPSRLKIGAPFGGGATSSLRPAIDHSSAPSRQVSSLARGMSDLLPDIAVLFRRESDRDWRKVAG